MEERSLSFYDGKPVLGMFHFTSPGHHWDRPEVLALLSAVLDKKNVTMKPNINVIVHGELFNPPENHPGLKNGDFVNTTRIEKIYFEDYKNPDDSDNVYSHLMIKTKNTTYMAATDLMSPLAKTQAKEMGRFEDYLDYFSDVNEEFPLIQHVD